MGIRGKLKGVEKELISDLAESRIPFLQLAKKYGVTRQGISNFCHRKGIKRPKKEHTESCSICQGLIRISRRPQSDFISSQTIKEELRIVTNEWKYHMHILRKNGLVSERFGRLHSKKAELGYRLYFMKRVTLKAIEKQVGLKNFSSIIRRHKISGWNIPPSYRRELRSNEPGKERV